MALLSKQCIWWTIISLSCFMCSNPEKKNNNSLNRLSKASSPYLREHADNPVNWFEWGDEALEKAKKEGKPIIVSVGYASCHWCHVMEEESFMDTAVARIMNEHFISIKVDREERPDIDQIYIDAAQLITGHAGWPLNVFGLPDGKPFYAATYFPKEQWISLLTQILEAYRDDLPNINKQAEAVMQGILTNDMISALAPRQSTDMLQAYGAIFPSWEPDLDYSSGGLAGAPKFPMPAVWEFLLQNYHQTNNDRALKVVTTTLDAMSNGGIYDHLAGGFARYATDIEWRVPHFEKMLYDNGQLVSLYAHAYQVTNNEVYAEVVDQTLEFVKQELTSPQGGFYSSLNADSEGEEGTFYVWTRSEIENLLDERAAGLFTSYFNVTEAGNWENRKNVLYKKASIEEVAANHTLSSAEAKQVLDESRELILAARNKRIRPTIDDKILTSWNALMLSGYVDAYWALGKQEYLDIALQNAAFLKKNMVRDDGGLWRSYSDGKVSIQAFLDDYAFLASAYIQLYQATFDIQWLNQALAITDYAIRHFHDPSTGFFYYTSDESKQLVARKIEIPDNVTPSSNAVMAEVLFKLGHYYESTVYETMSLKMVSSLSKDFLQNGPYFGRWASLMGQMAFQPYEVAVMGEDAEEKGRQLMKSYLPTVLFMGGESENLPLLENKYVKGKTIIYVCRDKVCKLPVQDVEQALLQLKVN